MNAPETSAAGALGRVARPAGISAPAPVSRRRVVSRLWRTAERQVAEIETRMAGIADDPQSLERDAKTLAIIAKTVRDLVAIDAEAAERGRRGRNNQDSPPHGSKDAASDRFGPDDSSTIDAGPRNIAGFRAELTRRLDELRRERLGDEAP